MSLGCSSATWRARYGAHCALLGGVRVAVGRRAALERVGDVSALRTCATAAAADSAQHVVEQLTGLVHEGLAFAVFGFVRGFAHHHPVGRRAAATEHGVAPALAQAAGATGGHRGFELQPVHLLDAFGERCEGGIGGTCRCHDTGARRWRRHRALRCAGHAWLGLARLRRLRFGGLNVARDRGCCRQDRGLRLRHRPRRPDREHPSRPASRAGAHRGRGTKEVSSAAPCTDNSGSRSRAGTGTPVSGCSGAALMALLPARALRPAAGSSRSRLRARWARQGSRPCARPPV